MGPASPRAAPRGAGQSSTRTAAGVVQHLERQDQTSAIVVIDDKTLELKKVIKDDVWSPRPASSTSTTQDRYLLIALGTRRGGRLPGQIAGVGMTGQVY